MTEAPVWSNDDARETVTTLLEEQDCLLQVAAVVATGAGSEEVLDAVAVQAARLAGGASAALFRAVGSSCTVVGRSRDASTSGIPDRWARGTQVDLRSDEEDLLVKALTDGRPAWRHARLPDEPARVCLPLRVGGRTWGALDVVIHDQRASVVERRLQRFLALVAGAVASATASAQLRDLEEERAALRRMHQVAGRGGSGREVLRAVVVEGAVLLGRPVLLAQLEDEETAAVVAAEAAAVPVGTRYATAGNSIVARVLRQQAPVRTDDDPGAVEGDLLDRSQEAEALVAPTTQPGSTGAPDAAPVGDEVGDIGHAPAPRGAVGVPITINGRLWGAMVVTSATEALPARTEDQLTAFAAAVLPTIAAADARAQLTEEQTALRRVAELVARGGAASEVFVAVTREASRLAQGAAMSLTRFEGPRQLLVMAAFGQPTAEVGERIDFAPDTLPDWVAAGRGAVRVNDYRRERDAELAERYGLRAAVAVPVLGAGSVWGMLTATSAIGPLSPDTEHRLVRFADLVAAALANGQARAEIQALADEQAALRRVAELVAQGTDLEELFPALIREASGIVDGLPGALMRFEPDDTAVIVAVNDNRVPVGLRLPPYPRTPVGDVLRTGRPARVDSFEDTPLREKARELEVGQAVAVPITVEGRLWGLMSLSTHGGPLPIDAEARLEKFADLGGAAVANAENRAKLQDSRARVIATADETRRRLQRDVHDGAQQRLVHTIISLKLARHAMASGNSPRDLVEEALTNAERASRDLRDVVSGILPAALTEGGLPAGLGSLVTDLMLPVDLQIRATRSSEDAELTAYFVVAEALTNVVKHARASQAWVEVFSDENALAVVVRDDGIGGADPSGGSGLLGLLDRVEAVKGTFSLTSPVGGGTTMDVRLPLLPGSGLGDGWPR